MQVEGSLLFIRSLSFAVSRLRATVNKFDIQFCQFKVAIEFQMRAADLAQLGF